MAIASQRARDADPKGGVRRRRRLAVRSPIAASATRPNTKDAPKARTNALADRKANGQKWWDLSETIEIHPLRQKRWRKGWRRSAGHEGHCRFCQQC
jgi:hypothetical protein